MENAIETKSATTGENAVEPTKTTKPKKKKSFLRIFLRIIGVFLLLILAAVIAVALILRGRIATASSVKQAGEGVYTINYQQNYSLDRALEYGIKNQDDLKDFISKELFFGLADRVNPEPPHCSAFLARTPDGQVVYGRNADMKGNTDALIVYSHPKGDYASYSLVAPAVLNVGEGYGIQPLSSMGRILMLAVPYLATEGMNEKGLVVSVLSISGPERHTDTEKPDILTTVSLRLLLDRAANVDEAIELLEKYDNHSFQGEANHLFIGDASGRSVVVEWQDSVMNVIEANVCTNFELSPGVTEGMCSRYDKIQQGLEQNPSPTTEQAFEILKSACVYQSVFTVWSTVYHPSEFTFDMAYNRKYKSLYHFTSEDF